MTKIRLKAPASRGGKLSTQVSVRSKASGNLLHSEKTETPIKPVRAEHVAYLRDVVSVKVSTGYNSCGVEVGVEIPFACNPGDLQSVHKNLDRVAALIEKRLTKKMAELDRILETLGDRRT